MARKRATNGSETGGTSANLGFEARLWLAADKLRNNMDAAEYKHVVLGLIFLKYISDIRGIEADIGKEHADTFRHVQHPGLCADYALANPPFYVSRSTADVALPAID